MGQRRLPRCRQSNQQDANNRLGYRHRRVYDLRGALAARRGLFRLRKRRGLGHHDGAAARHGECAHAGGGRAARVAIFYRRRLDEGLEEHAGLEGGYAVSREVFAGLWRVGSGTCCCGSEWDGGMMEVKIELNGVTGMG
jgi:hypothetical protein